MRKDESILAFIVVLLPILSSAYLLLASPSGYNYDMYSQYPSLGWISAIFGLTLTTLAPFLANGRRQYLFAIFGAIFYIQILILPYVLGYVLINRADEMFIPGEIRTIFSTGTFYSGYDKYPLVSILYSILFSVSGISHYIRYLILVPIFFSLIFVMILFLIFRKLLLSRHWYFLIIPLSFIYYLSFYHISIHPAFYSFVLSLLAIYVLLSTTPASNSMKIIQMLLLATLPFSHPYYNTTTLIFLSLLVVYYVLEVETFKETHTLLRDYTIMGITSFIIFVAWIFNNSATYQGLEMIIKAFQQAYLEPAFNEGTSLSSGLSLLEKLIFLFGYLGRYSLIFVMSLLIMIFGIKKHVINWRFVVDNKFAIYIVLALFILQSILLFTPFFGHYPERHLNINYLSVAVPLGFLILLTKFHPTFRVRLLIVALLSGVLLLSALSLYNYPKISLRSNSGITSNEILSISFIFNKESPEILIFSPYDQIVRRYCEFYNISKYKECGYKHIRYTYSKIFPDHHFGYVDYNKFTLFVPVKEAYIVLTDYATQKYLYIPPYRRTGRINISDYTHVNVDNSLHRIYSGLDIRIYLYHTQSARI